MSAALGKYRNVRSRNPHAFTLVELIVVIVIIGILAAIAAIAYNFFIDRAGEAAKESTATQTATLIQAQSAQDQSVACSLDAARDPEGSQQALTDLPYAGDIPQDVSTVYMNSCNLSVVFDDGTVCSGVSFPLDQPGASYTGSWTCTGSQRPSGSTTVNSSAGNGSLTVSWTPVPNDGSSDIVEYIATATPLIAQSNATNDGSPSTSGYIATASPDDPYCTATNPDTSCTITGLTNGVEYTTSVTVRTVTGTSSTTGVSTSSMPAGAPNPPTTVTLTPATNSLLASWTAPVNDGGTPVTSYTATTNTGESCVATAPATSCTIPGLDYTLSYTVTVTATNAAGTSESSAASSPAEPLGVSSAPTSLLFSPALNAVTVSWDAPVDASEVSVTSYTATSDQGGSCTATAPATSCTITGLDPNLTHSVTVKALNGIGASAPSDALTTTTTWQCPSSFNDEEFLSAPYTYQTQEYTYTRTKVGTETYTDTCASAYWDAEGNYHWVEQPHACTRTRDVYADVKDPTPAGWEDTGTLWRKKDPIPEGGWVDNGTQYVWYPSGDHGVCSKSEPYTYQTQQYTYTYKKTGTRTVWDTCASGYTDANGQFHWIQQPHPCSRTVDVYGNVKDPTPAGWEDTGTLWRKKDPTPDDWGDDGTQFLLFVDKQGYLS